MSDSVAAVLNDTQQTQVRALTRQYIQKASIYAKCSTPEIKITFDLRGAAAGLYCVRSGRPEIRYNPYIFARYYDDNLANTIPHEVAHYVADLLFGARNIKPHGSEWRKIVVALGACTQRTHHYDLTGIPRRSEQQYIYICNCREHKISSRRHNRINRGKMRYRCQLCNAELIIKPDRTSKDYE
ncbi:MAG: SprT-like domain-containing protein [Gammaproteobacteria bacterium]|nr:SprT-like domain-containing protein [Gammaproteobacteria bacterium]